jgi:hypothetical protein
MMAMSPGVVGLAAPAALPKTAISWAGTAGLTSRTVSMPRMAASSVSGRSKSPVAISMSP